LATPEPGKKNATWSAAKEDETMQMRQIVRAADW
jgi:hypothetical protein